MSPDPPRAVPHGLEAYPSLQAAFAAPQPRQRFGLQTHGSTVQPRMNVKTPTNTKVCDTTLPTYQHDTDNALAVDVGVLWRALDEHTPEHASYTTDKCKFNHDVDYLGDAALVAKLRSLPDFPALKAFLVEVLEPPPRPAKAQGGQATPNKRKWAGGDWPNRKQLYKGQGDLFERLLTRDNLTGFGAAERLYLPTAAMKAEPFNWQPAEAACKEPPTLLVTCAELGEVDVDATLGKRTTDGYRMGRGTQGLLSKLKAKPGDVMELRVTNREGDTIHANLQLKRQQRASVEAAAASTGSAPSSGGAAAGGSIGQNPSTAGATPAGHPARRGSLPGFSSHEERLTDGGPDMSSDPPRAVPRGLEAFPSLLRAFAAAPLQPGSLRGVQQHPSGWQARLRVDTKSPKSQGVSDNQLPAYQHLALVRDVAELWRALDQDESHALFTLDKCQFNIDAGYAEDAALVAKLQSLPDFGALKAWLVEVLVPPPRPAKPQGGQATPKKRKWAGGDWPNRKQLYKGQGDLFERLLTRDNLTGFGAAERLYLPTAALKAEPFNWQPAEVASKEPPTLLITCAELGEVDVDATLGKRTTDGYRMGRGTQGLLSKLKAKPGDVMELRVTNREGDTIHANLQLKRQQRASVEAAAASTGSAPSSGGAAAGGSIGQNPSTAGATPAGHPARRGSLPGFSSHEERLTDGGPDMSSDPPRAVPRGLEAFPSLLRAFAAPPLQPGSLRGVQQHPSGWQARLRVDTKSPKSQGVSDNQLPAYQHLTDLALVRDVAELWRALDQDESHALFTLDKCQFNIDAGYAEDAALVAKLQSLPDFGALKAWLVEVLVPPPRPAKPQGVQATPKKRKGQLDGLDWPDKKRHFRVTCDTYDKVLTEKGMKRLTISSAAMGAEPFSWQPAEAASKEPPTLLITCAELGVAGVDAQLGKRTADGYRMGRGTQGLLSKLKAKPGDVMELRVTKREGDTIHANLQLKRAPAQAAPATYDGWAVPLKPGDYERLFGSGLEDKNGEVHSKHPHRTSTGKQNLSVPVAATEAEALGQTTLMPEQQAQQQQQRRRQAQQQAQQAQRADGERGGRSSGAGAEDSPYPATAELAETVLQQRLSKAIQDLEAAADGDQRLRALLWLASVGHGGALLQETVRRWGSLPEECRELVAIAVQALPLHNDCQQELVPQLQLALTTSGQDWHTGITEGGSGGPGAERSPTLVVQCRQRAAAACEKAAALLMSGQEAPSHMMQPPLGCLRLVSIGGAPLKEVVDGWASYNPVQQRKLFEDVLVAVHQGAWQQLEARMRAALQLLPYLADDA